MYLYVVFCTPEERWLALAPGERVAWLGRALDTLEDALGLDATLAGHTLDRQNDTAAGYRYLFAWNLADRTSAARLDAALEGGGWRRYFNVMVIGGENMLRDHFIESVAGAGEWDPGRGEGSRKWIATLFPETESEDAVAPAIPVHDADTPAYSDPVAYPWFDRDAYLRRINYDGPLDTDERTLHALHRAHLIAVPFENLDIHLSRPILLDERSIYEKIVTGRRGGFCYELNGLFAMLLRSLGYNVTLLSAGVYNGTTFGPEFDHLTLLVHHDRRWLADVGFGDAFAEPLLLDELGEQQQDTGLYRIETAGGSRLLQQRGDDGAWVPMHRFSLRPRMLPEFARMCDYHQLSPDSPFPRRWFCSRMTTGGRISITGRRIIRTVRGERIESPFTDPREALDALREHFGIDLEESALRAPAEEQSVGE